MANRYIVRYGVTRRVAEFSVKGNMEFTRNAEVIVRSSRGTEWATVLCPATDRTQDFLESRESGGKILRTATADDRRLLEQQREMAADEYKGCVECIVQRKLQMKLVDVEHLFGGERVVFYYLAEDRVDFRDLVKDLAARFRARIEMRQIGVRDEAKLLADYGDCGKPVCCNTFLTRMPPVSMKMAKLQKATLDPSKISGRCGRLKCCLRYEQDTYEEYRRELPKVGATVVTKQGQGKVIGQEILAKKVLVQYESDRRMLVDGADILTVIRKVQSN